METPSETGVREIAEVYERMAEEYDDVREPFYKISYAVYAAELARFLSGRHFSLALDIGCGTGLQTVLLAAHAEVVIGVDLSPDLLRIAQDRCRRYPHVHFVRADVRALPFRDGVASGVISLGEVLSHIPEVETAVAEIGRVCRAEAPLLFDVNNKWYLGLLYNPREFLRALRSRRGHLRLWSYTYRDTSRITLPMRTVSRTELGHLLTTHNLVVLSRIGYNILPCLVPERYLFSPHASPALQRIVHRLGHWEAMVRGVPLLRDLGYNWIVHARKTRPGTLPSP